MLPTCHAAPRKRAMILHRRRRLSANDRKETDVPQITELGRVIIPVSDQDTGIAFYTEKLGFSVAADMPYGNGERWVEVAPPGGGAQIALSPGRDEYQPGRTTGIALS